MENIELNRQLNYIIAVHNQTDRFALENSVEEAELYLEKYKMRKAVIFSDTYRNDNLMKIAYNQVQTFRKGELRIVDKKDNDNFNEVIKTMGIFLKNGLVIIHNYQPDGGTINELLRRTDKAQDIIIHRNKITLYAEEIDYINSEIERANQSVASKTAYVPRKNIFFRIHSLDSFKFTRDYLLNLANTFGQEIGFGIFLSQFILLRKSNEFRKELENQCEQKDEKFEDFIDPYWFAKLSSNYVYFNPVTMHIAGASAEFIEKVKNEIVSYFKQNGN
jgi:hypothetical protein